MQKFAENSHRRWLLTVGCLLPTLSFVKWLSTLLPQPNRATQAELSFINLQQGTEEHRQECTTTVNFSHPPAHLLPAKGKANPATPRRKVPLPHGARQSGAQCRGWPPKGPAALPSASCSWVGLQLHRGMLHQAQTRTGALPQRESKKEDQSPARASRGTWAGCIPKIHLQFAYHGWVLHAAAVNCDRSSAAAQKSRPSHTLTAWSATAGSWSAQGSKDMSWLGQLPSQVTHKMHSEHTVPARDRSLCQRSRRDAALHTHRVPSSSFALAAFILVPDLSVTPWTASLKATQKAKRCYRSLCLLLDASTCFVGRWNKACSLTSSRIGLVYLHQKIFCKEKPHAVKWG